MQFLNRHVQDTLITMEAGNLPHPRCPHCDVLFPWVALNFRHPNTTQCAKGVERKRHRLADEEMQASN